MLNTWESDHIRILHRAKFDQEGLHCYYFTQACISCNWALCCALDRATDQTYLYVRENAIEVNYVGVPKCGVSFSFFLFFFLIGFQCCCSCSTVDDVHVYYLDTPITKHAQRARCCSPSCTHGECCPETYCCCLYQCLFCICCCKWCGKL